MRVSLSCVISAALAGVVTAQSSQYATFASGCSGSLPTTRLILGEPPITGATLRVYLDNLPANVAFMQSGLSNTVSPFGPLPLALGSFGMPGCLVHVSPDVTMLVLGAGNLATYAIAIPPGPGLVGVQFFQQALVLDPGPSNAAGAVISDAASAVIGLPGWPTGGPPVANMVPIAAGSFQMGSTQGYPVEQPVHTVTITRPFWMGKYEVTQAEYQALMYSSPSYTQGANHPVEMVSWGDAIGYCAVLTVQEATANRLPTGYQYRLPTEAEWEYCCRAGTTTEYNVGATLSCSQANIGGCTGISHTTVVGSYAANPWGLHDMHGNVSEWCLDSWDLSANYPAAPVSDPYVTSGLFRVRRGGSWYYGFPAACRSAVRRANDPPTPGYNLGFRVVLAPTL